MNSNPSKARAAKKRKRQQAGDLAELRRKVWTAIEVTEKILIDPDTPDEISLRAVHALTQTSASYIKLVESIELEARVSALEAAKESLTI